MRDEYKLTNITKKNSYILFKVYVAMKNRDKETPIVIAFIAPKAQLIIENFKEVSVYHA